MRGSGNDGVGPGDVVDVQRRRSGRGRRRRAAPADRRCARCSPSVAPSMRELPGGVPVERALTLRGPGHVAEHRERRERVVVRRRLVGSSWPTMPSMLRAVVPGNVTADGDPRAAARRRAPHACVRAWRRRQPGWCVADPRCARSTRSTCRGSATHRLTPADRALRHGRRRRARRPRLLGPPRARASPKAAAELLADAERARRRHAGRGVVGDGVRRDRQQPDPAHRGGGAAARPDVRLRPPAGVGRGARRGVATRAPTAVGHGAAAGDPDRRRRHVVAGAGARRQGSVTVSARPTRSPSSCTTTTWRRPSRSRSNAGSTASTTSRPMAASPAIGCARSAAERLRLPLPERIAEWSVRCGGGSSAARSRPGCARTRAQPWTVANDKLRSAGWTPTVTNEQAYVEGTEAKWWTMVTPKRRQEIALGAMVGVIAVGVDRRRSRVVVVATAVRVRRISTSLTSIGVNRRRRRRRAGCTGRSGRRRRRAPACPLRRRRRRAQRTRSCTGGSASTVTISSAIAACRSRRRDRDRTPRHRATTSDAAARRPDRRRRP